MRYGAIFNFFSKVSNGSVVNYATTSALRAAEAPDREIHKDVC